MKDLKLYIDSIEKMKILKRKMPKVKWYSGNDILDFNPGFPFIAHINKIQQMTYCGTVFYDIEERLNLMAETDKFFNFSKLLEIE